MATGKIKLESIKDSDGWNELAYTVAFEKFKKEHPEIEDEDDLSDEFYQEVIAKTFEYGEYADLEIEVDENFNIIGGKIIPFKK